LGNRVEIERASPGDADALTRVAFASKRYWGYPERWISHWTATLTITPEFVGNNEVYAAFSGGEPIGFYALTGEGRELELHHLWISPAWIGSGIGRLLFEHAMERAASRGASIVEIEADPNAEGFYLRMGARLVRENVYDMEGERRALPLLRVELSGDKPGTES
jgi:GNAT superfamily N-acetyltransferase